ncbi:MAG: helix-turn-helix domain-containing protein [Bacillota bacterium]
MQNYIKDGRRFNFTMIDNELLEREDLGTYEKLLYITLCKFAGQENTCFPSRKTLAKLVSCSVKTIDNKLKNLIDKGLISKEKRRNDKGEHTSNLYIIRGVAKEIRQGGVTDSPRGVTDSPELYSINNKTEEEERAEIPKQISTKFQQIFNRQLTAELYQKLIKIYSDPKILMKALEVAEEKADKPAYLIKILMDWKKNNLTSTADIDQYLEQRKKEPKKKSVKVTDQVKDPDKANKLHDPKYLTQNGWN